MITLKSVELRGRGVILEPLSVEHERGLTEAAADGELWNLWFTYVPAPDETARYIADALEGQNAGLMLCWAVRDEHTGRIVGSTRYHDVVAQVDRVEIGYTWYARAAQRTHVNTACKLLLMTHAFESLGCKVVGFRTDGNNLRSQRALEALGAHRDGRVRHHGIRRDGTPRDNVYYSVLAEEWPDIRRYLELRPGPSA